MKSTLGLTALAAALTLGMTGCNYSDGREVIKSTEAAPKTVYAYYINTGETVWTYNIPPNTKLRVDLDTQGAGPELFYRTEGAPTTLSYKLFDINAKPSLFRRNMFYGTVQDSGSMELDGGQVGWRWTITQSVAASEEPGERSVEEIEKDIDQLPEPGEDDDLPEPDAE